MFNITTEQHECIQGSGEYCAYILRNGSERFFATEDIEYLLNSPKLFKEEPGSTLILNWDRNSQEAPELGPEMSIEIHSDLYVRNSGQELILEYKEGEKRIQIYTTPLRDWTRIVEQLNQNELKWGRSGELKWGRSVILIIANLLTSISLPFQHDVDVTDSRRYDDAFVDGQYRICPPLQRSKK